MSASENTAALDTEQSEPGAVPVSEKEYHGLPCKVCGGTRRLRSNRSCVPCARARFRKWHRDKLVDDPEWAEHHRARRRTKYATDSEYRERVKAKVREQREIKSQDPEWVERERLRRRDYFYGLDHIKYYEQQMRSRRHKALKRKEARHRGSLSDEG